MVQNYLSNEQKLIEDIRSKIGNRFIGDDCAKLPGNLLVTSDTLVEDTHFILEQEKARLESLGWKSMAVSLSDIAAMAGHPRYALVAITMPDKLSRRSFAHLYNGLVECCKHYKTAIVGGDITKGALLSITTTIIGEVNQNGCLLRNGAKIGDVVIVTGDFGASKAGLKLLLDRDQAKINARAARRQFYACLSAHNRPVPRLAEAWALVNEIGSRGALMDASDGLADALAQISRKSNVGMRIDLDKIPIQVQTTALANLYKDEPLDWALYGGEDYELVACLSEEAWQVWCNKAKPPFQAIGKVTDTNEIELMFGKKEGPRLDLARSFQHLTKL
jgi:thiamine-monophosphate kinase